MASRMIAGSTALRGTAAGVAARMGASRSALVPARTMHSSKVNRDAAHGTSAHAEHEHEHYPSEGFGAPIWRYTFLTGIAVAAWYRYSSSYQGQGHDGADGDHDEEEEDANKPFLTRYIEYHMPKVALWEGRSARHLEAARQNAEDRIFFSTVERPPIRRTSPTFNGTGSPNRQAVGDGVDMSSVEPRR